LAKTLPYFPQIPEEKQSGTRNILLIVY